METIVDSNVTIHNEDARMLNMFILMQNTQSPETARTYRSTLERFMRYVNKPMREVTLSDLIEYTQSLSDKAPSTQKRMITTIRSFFAFLSMHPGYLIANPAVALKPPKVVKSDEVEHILTKEEVKKLRDVLRFRNYRNYLIATMLFATGLRVSELTNAVWGDIKIDLDNHIGLVVTGKGRKRRTVKIPKRLFDQIVEYRKSVGLSYEIDPSDDTPLFINRKGGALTPRYIEAMIEDAAKRARINKRVTPHWFRHSHATHALHNGATVYQVKEALGHSSLNTSQVYLHTLNRLQETTSDYIELDD